MTSPSLFDALASEQARDEGIARVERANAAWVELALDALLIVALRQPLFTSDDVWKLLGDNAGYTDPRCMGAVFVRARKLKRIDTTAAFVPTKKVSQHRQHIRVWRSLIYVPCQDGEKETR